MTETGDTTGPTIQPAGRWRKSSFSPNSNCVELAEFPDDTIGMRNSNDPDGLTFYLPREVVSALIQGAKAGEFDGLV